MMTVISHPDGRGIYVSNFLWNDANYALTNGDRIYEFQWVGSRSWHTDNSTLLWAIPWYEVLSFGEYVEVEEGEQPRD